MSAAVVGQGDVNELVQPARTEDGWIDDVGSVGGADDEDVFLGSHAVHLGKDLVDDTVGSTAGVAHRTTSGLGDRVQLVEEQDARCGGPIKQTISNSIIFDTFYKRKQICTCLEISVQLFSVRKLDLAWVRLILTRVKEPFQV